MDVPFSVNEWLPSEPREFSESLPDPERVAKFIDRLTVTTNFILRHPYDPNSWLGRARALTVLRYPELAAGDAHKAILLCRSILLGIDRKTARFRLGSRMGFWMRDEVDSMSFTDLDDWKVEREYYGEKFTDLQEHARDVLDRNLFFTPAYDEGRYTPQPYPWLEEKHRTRSDELVAAMNEELADPAKRNGLPSCCVLKRRAFGDGVGNGDGEDVLGVFATQDILEGEVVLVDKTSTWGCNGPGRDGKPLRGETGCHDPLHPNSPSDPTTYDMRWIRDRTGKKAADVILRCKLLLCSLTSDVSSPNSSSNITRHNHHPFDHPLIARLTPTYHRTDKVRGFSLENEIVVPNEALQQFGVDIFVDLHYDTWVLFTLYARIDNNSWSDPNTSCLNPLFALFNHSCEPNVDWTTTRGHFTIQMKASRTVQKGEQLFVEYDQYLRGQGLQERRKRMLRWIGGLCQCSRCVREEREEASELEAEDEKKQERNPGEGKNWDSDEKPVFPEDEVNTEFSRWRSRD